MFATLLHRLLVLAAFVIAASSALAQDAVPVPQSQLPAPVASAPNVPVPVSQLPATAANAAMPLPPQPSLPVKSYVLMDYDTGQVLAEQDADKRVEPASITKIMAAFVVFEELKAGRLKLTDLVTISEKAWRMEGSRMFAKVGDQIPVEQLMLGMIVTSGNDSTVALAEHLGGTEDAFVSMMNTYAQKYGLKNTRFANSAGLSHPDHYSTARDIAALARIIIEKHPEYYKWYAVRKYTWNNVEQYNRNQLLARDSSVDGMKTGHTSSAGYCLVSSAKRDDFRLVAVVMGSESETLRTSQSQAVLNYGFRFFESHQLYANAQKLKSMELYKGEADAVDLGVQNGLRVVIPRGHYTKLQAAMEVPNVLIAPVTQNQAIGRVRVRLDGKLLAERPLVALQAVPEGGFFSRMADSIALWWNE
jgi:serine-type D-Ala-D-Ala carboxypeptidase (penicillin-binding protein 5/6)